MMSSKNVTDLAAKINKLPPVGMLKVKMSLADTPEKKAAAMKEAEAVLDAEKPGWRDDLANERASSTLQTIREYAADVEKTKQNIATLKEQITEIKESMTEYSHFEEAKEVYDLAKRDLELALQGRGNYNDLMEKVAELDHKLKDQKDILSLHIVEYHADTRAQQIEMDDLTGDAREVVVTGKLGKKGKFQTSLFSDKDGLQAGNVTIKGE